MCYFIPHILINLKYLNIVAYYQYKYSKLCCRHGYEHGTDRACGLSHIKSIRIN